MTDPLTDDILIAVEAAQERARNCRREDGTYLMPALFSGFDLHPAIVAALIGDTTETHAGRLAAGADPQTVMASQFCTGLLIGLFVGEVRQGRRIAGAA